MRRSEGLDPRGFTEQTSLLRLRVDEDDLGEDEAEKDLEESDDDPVLDDVPLARQIINVTTPGCWLKFVNSTPGIARNRNKIELFLEFFNMLRHWTEGLELIRSQWFCIRQII